MFHTTVHYETLKETFVLAEWMSKSFLLHFLRTLQFSNSKISCHIWPGLWSGLHPMLLPYPLMQLSCFLPGFCSHSPMPFYALLQEQTPWRDSRFQALAERPHDVDQLNKGGLGERLMFQNIFLESCLPGSPIICQTLPQYRELS